MILFGIQAVQEGSIQHDIQIAHRGQLILVEIGGSVVRELYIGYLLNI